MAEPIDEVEPEAFPKDQGAPHGFPSIPKKYRQQDLALAATAEWPEEADWVIEILMQAQIPAWHIPPGWRDYSKDAPRIPEGHYGLLVPCEKLEAAEVTLAAVETPRAEVREEARKKHATTEAKLRLWQERVARNFDFVPEATTTAQRQHARSALWMIVLTFFLAPIAPIMLGYNIRLLRRIRSDQARLGIDAMEENPLPLAIISTGLAALWCAVMALIALGVVLQG